MRFTRKNKISLFILFVIINVVIRIPIIPHEIGADSYYIHQYADSITEYGEIKWIEHPIQLLGFGTAPPALQILISGLTQCLGISSELSILLLSFLCGILGAIIAYIFIYSVTNDDYISYLGALIFSLSPLFLRLTIWTATTRSLFVALLPLFLYLLFKSINTKRKLSFIVLLFSVYALLMATHHLGVLLLFYLFPLFILFLFKIFEKIKFIEVINTKIITFMWISLFLLLFLPVVLKLGFLEDYAFLWKIYQSGRFFQGEGFHVVPLNMIFDYASKIGILLPFAIIGIIVLLFRTKRRLFENYVLTFLLLVTPILAVGIYTPMLVLIIFAFLISVGLARFTDFNILRKKTKIVLPVFLVATLCFSVFMLVLWGIFTVDSLGDKYAEQTKNAGFFLKKYGVNGSFTSNDRTYIYRFSVYSSMLNAPSNLYKQCFMERKKIKARLNPDIKSVIAGHGENIIVFEKERDENVRNPWHDYGFVWRNDPDGDRNRLDYYNINYCVETNFGVDPDGAKKMNLFEKMRESRPKIYDNKIEDIYFIG